MNGTRTTRTADSTVIGFASLAAAGETALMWAMFGWPGGVAVVSLWLLIWVVAEAYAAGKRATVDV